MRNILVSTDAHRGQKSQILFETQMCVNLGIQVRKTKFDSSARA